MGTWKITALDYDAALFTNSEARLGAGIGPALWAKWLHRHFFTPSRAVKGGRGGQYAPKKIFELRVMNLMTTDVALPPSEAKQIAYLAAKGTWNSAELKKENNWRSYVIRDNPLPLDIFLLYSRDKSCWGHEMSVGPPKTEDLAKNSVLLVLAATRELIAVSKYCWNILEGPDRAV